MGIRILTREDYQAGKVSCAYCGEPILDSRKAMEHRPTQKLYHEDPCFEKALNEQLEKGGLNTSSMPPELSDVIRGLFGIQSRSEK